MGGASSSDTTDLMLVDKDNLLVFSAGLMLVLLRHALTLAWVLDSTSVLANRPSVSWCRGRTAHIRLPNLSSEKCPNEEDLVSRHPYA